VASGDAAAAAASYVQRQHLQSAVCYGYAMVGDRSQLMLLAALAKGWQGRGERLAFVRRQRLKRAVQCSLVVCVQHAHTPGCMARVHGLWVLNVVSLLCASCLLQVCLRRCWALRMQSSQMS
jgi:hypothetical protein